jgi:hypothetical protein
VQRALDHAERRHVNLQDGTASIVTDEAEAGGEGAEQANRRGPTALRIAGLKIEGTGNGAYEFMAKNLERDSAEGSLTYLVANPGAGAPPGRLKISMKDRTSWKIIEYKTGQITAIKFVFRPEVGGQPRSQLVFEMASAPTFKSLLNGVLVGGWQHRAEVCQDYTGGAAIDSHTVSLIMYLKVMQQVHKDIQERAPHDLKAKVSVV